MIRMIEYMILGYLSGSVLYARVFSRLLGKDNIYDRSKDRNPGTANAFTYGGFWCGAGTLLGDLIKGFVPVWLYLRGASGSPTLALALVKQILKLSGGEIQADNLPGGGCRFTVTLYPGN